MEHSKDPRLGSEEEEKEGSQELEIEDNVDITPTEPKTEDSNEGDFHDDRED